MVQTRFLAAAAAIVVLCGLIGPASATKCPNITSFRSQSVLHDFDAAKLDGFWYEQAYIDIAQVGASCQTLNSTLNVTSGQMAMAFSVMYGPLPFTLTELYTPVSPPEIGYYIKRAKMPGAKLLELPTVVVDATVGADGKYDTMTLYSCLDALGVLPVTELVMATRLKTPATGTLPAMEAKAQALGVPFDVKSLHHVDWSSCKN